MVIDRTSRVLRTLLNITWYLNPALGRSSLKGGMSDEISGSRKEDGGYTEDGDFLRISQKRNFQQQQRSD